MMDIPRLNCGCPEPKIISWVNDHHKKFQKCTICNFELSWDDIWINHWSAVHNRRTCKRDTNK